MPRSERFHACLIASATIAVALCGCSGEGERSSAHEENVEGSHDASDQNESADASDGDGSTSSLEDARTVDGSDSAGYADCPDAPMPLSEGELQNQASGPSIFGRMVVAGQGLIDPIGGISCGIEGVRICLFGTEVCTESDAAGQFVLLGLPDDTDIEVTFEKAGITSSIRLAHTQGVPINLRETSMLPDSARLAALQAVGLDEVDGVGAVVALPIVPAEAVGTVSIPEGVQITLMPGDARPYYSRGAVGDDGLSSDETDLSLEATAEGGWALFMQVEPGDYTVRFEREGELCSTLFPGFAFGVDDLGHIRIRVRAGFTTSSIVALCP